MPTIQLDTPHLMTSPTLRFHLRERTQPAHQRLDGMIGPLDTPERYRAFVAGSHAHRDAAEGYLEAVAWPDSFRDWRPLRLEPLIAQDLADLGHMAREGTALGLSKDISSAVGVAYVLEGSALGARLIAKMALRLGFDASHGARHIAGQERGLGNWRAFTSIIEEAAWIDRDAAAAAASATFEHALDAMKDNGCC